MGVEREICLTRRLDLAYWSQRKTTSDGGSHPEQEQGPSPAFYSCWLSICVCVCVSLSIGDDCWLARSLARTAT